MEAKIYNQKGDSTETIKLPKSICAKWRADLVHQVVYSMRSNKRAGTADTKDRGEVRGGGKNHGNKKELDELDMDHLEVLFGLVEELLMDHFLLKIIKKISKRCVHKLCFLCFQKDERWRNTFVDSLTVSDIKTKQALSVFKNLAKVLKSKTLINSKKPKVLTALFERNEKTEKVLGIYPN